MRRRGRAKWDRVRARKRWLDREMRERNAGGPIKPTEPGQDLHSVSAAFDGQCVVVKEQEIKWLGAATTQTTYHDVAGKLHVGRHSATGLTHKPYINRAASSTSGLCRGETQ